MDMDDAFSLAQNAPASALLAAGTVTENTGMQTFRTV
jgi:hypothetical protein